MHGSTINGKWKPTGKTQWRDAVEDDEFVVTHTKNGAPSYPKVLQLQFKRKVKIPMGEGDFHKETEFEWRDVDGAQ